MASTLGLWTMPARSRTAMFLARMERLRALRQFVEAFCTEAGVSEHHCLRLNLVLEELFTNTVRHGHRGDSDAPVWVTLSATPDSLQLTYEDTAPPFNPYGKPPDTSPDTTLETRSPGGWGVLLTRKLAASREYAYLYGRNRIRLAFALNQAENR
jgi:serine/threonine-protein kinase RsbW